MLNKKEAEKLAEFLGKMDKTELMVTKGAIEILLIMKRSKK